MIVFEFTLKVPYEDFIIKNFVVEATEFLTFLNQYLG